MKTRQGFVSNSSSSSFVCSVCNETASGYDMGLSDADMFQCVNGHCMCNSHMRDVEELSVEDKRAVLRGKVENSPHYYSKPENAQARQRKEEIAALDEFGVEDSYSDYEADEGKQPKFCPICMFEKVDSDEAVNYLMKKNGLTKETLASEIKKSFVNYDEFKTFLVGKK